MDREKVIKGLECCLGANDCDIEPEEDCPYKGLCLCAMALRFDILALLKEQEAVKRTYRTGVNGFSIIWTCGACGSDLHPNNAKAKYCSNCGQAVKWDE